jgi:hypothetical protein
MEQEELVPLNVAARRIFQRVYLPFHHPQSAPGADQLNGVASALCGLAPVYALDERGATTRRLTPDELADGREPIRNLAVSASELERAARALHDAVSG